MALPLTDLLSWACLLAGGFFSIVGGIGMLRLPDLCARGAQSPSRVVRNGDAEPTPALLRLLHVPGDTQYPKQAAGLT